MFFNYKKIKSLNKKNTKLFNLFLNQKWNLLIKLIILILFKFSHYILSVSTGKFFCKEPNVNEKRWLVWKHTKLVKVGDSQLLKCNFFLKDYKWHGSTSNIKRHLATKHDVKVDEKKMRVRKKVQLQVGLYSGISCFETNLIFLFCLQSF